MRRKLTYLLLTAVLLVCFLSTTLLAACGNDDKEPKRAIIVLPGLLGSALIEEGEETPFWDPLTKTDITLGQFFKDPVATASEAIADEGFENITNILNKIIDCDPHSMFPLLKQSEDGENVTNVRAVTWDYKGSQRYGALQAYKPLWQAMQNRYGKYYEVRVYEYDWRMDNRLSAQGLEKLINDNGYDEVILCAHSMGNLVVANYLGRSEANRNKVTAFCSYAGPYYGALAALTMLEDPYSIIDMLDNLDDDMQAVLAPFSGMVDRVKTMYYDYCVDVILNMTSVAQLLPTIELVNTLQFAEGESFVTVDGKPITTNEELIEFYKSRDWAKKKDGTMRKFVAELEDYFNASYVTVNGERVHSTSLVDTYYFAGTGVLTTESVPIKNDNMSTRGITSSMLGDGTVPLYSATLGKVAADEDVLVLDEHDHFAVGCSIEGDMLETTYNFIDSKIPNDILEEILDDLD